MRATKINKNQGTTFLFLLKRMQHTALVSKNKNDDEYKRQFKFVNSRDVKVNGFIWSDTRASLWQLFVRQP